MGELTEHIVQFDAYCEKCEHYNLPESSDPCDICLATPTNMNSCKPVMFKHKMKGAK